MEEFECESKEIYVAVQNAGMVPGANRQIWSTHSIGGISLAYSIGGI
jgi:hypothetical protein